MTWNFLAFFICYSVADIDFFVYFCYNNCYLSRTDNLVRDKRTGKVIMEALIYALVLLFLVGACLWGPIHALVRTLRHTSPGRLEIETGPTPATSTIRTTEEAIPWKTHNSYIANPNELR